MGCERAGDAVPGRIVVMDVTRSGNVRRTGTDDKADGSLGPAGANRD